MTIINPIICSNCKEELQPKDIGIEIRNGRLIAFCRMCVHKIKTIK